MQYKVEVNTVSCLPGVFTSNGVVYDTHDAAKTAAISLSQRWTAVKDWRVVDTQGNVHQGSQDNGNN